MRVVRTRKRNREIVLPDYAPRVNLRALMVTRSRKRRLQLLSGISWLAAAGLATACCCRSPERAAQAKARLLASNRERAEPSMRMAAEAVGAVLLPATPTRVIQVGACSNRDLPEAQTCISWASDDGLAFRWRDPTGSESLGVKVDSPFWLFARLARRGDTLVLLVPVVTRRLVSRETECECREGSSGYFDFALEIQSVFLLGDLPLDGVEVVNVPIIEDFVEWRCALVVGGT